MRHNTHDRLTKVMTADYGQAYSAFQNAMFTHYCKTTSAVRLLLTFLLVTVAPLAAVFSVIGWPVESISKGLTGRNSFNHSKVLSSVFIALSCFTSGIKNSFQIPF